MSRIIRLIPPKGTDEANAEGRAYHPHDDGFFYIPEEDIGPLLHVGGFSLAPEVVASAVPIYERRPVTLADIDALARLLGALAEVAKTAPPASAPAIENATPFASSIPRLVMPAIPSRGPVAGG